MPPPSRSPVEVIDLTNDDDPVTNNNQHTLPCIRLRDDDPVPLRQANDVENPPPPFVSLPNLSLKVFTDVKDAFRVTGLGTKPHSFIFNKYRGHFKPATLSWYVSRWNSKGFIEDLCALNEENGSIRQELTNAGRYLFGSLNIRIVCCDSKYYVEGAQGHPEATTKYADLLREIDGAKFGVRNDPKNRGYSIGAWSVPPHFLHLLVEKFTLLNAGAQELSELANSVSFFERSQLAYFALGARAPFERDGVVIPIDANAVSTIPLKTDFYMLGGQYRHLTAQNLAVVNQKLTANGRRSVAPGQYWQFLRVHIPFLIRVLLRHEKEKRNGVIPVACPLRFANADVRVYPHIDYEKRAEFFVVKTPDAGYAWALGALCIPSLGEHFESRLGWVFRLTRRGHVLDILKREVFDGEEPQEIAENFYHFRPQIGRILEGRNQDRR